MGASSDKQASKQDSLRTTQKAIKITCPFCENLFHTDRHKPLKICSNQHIICSNCMQSIKRYSKLRGQQNVKCPFCKQLIKEDGIQYDEKLYKILDKEKKTLKNLPTNMVKLFIFSTIYLPELNKLMKWQSPSQKLQMIRTIRIKGKMLQEYQVFEMDMLDCLPNLQKLYLNNNQIKIIDTIGYQQSKLALLDVSENQIFSMTALLSDNYEPFGFLKILILKKNQIEEIKGLKKLKYLQILNLGFNAIKTMDGLQQLVSLKELNLENNIISKLQYLDNFQTIRSLFLFGNKIHYQSWLDFLSNDLSQLRVLSLSIQQCIPVERHSFLKSIRKKRWKYLQLIIVDSLSQQEDYDQVNDIGFQPQRLSLVKICQQNYHFYAGNQSSFLSKTLLAIKRYDRLGENVNFTAIQFTQEHYEVNQNTNIITKMTDNNDPKDFLYHFQCYSSQYSDKKYYFAFKSTCTNLNLGICYIIALTEDSIDVDLEKGVYTYQNQTKPILNYGSLKLQLKTQFQCCVCVDLLDQKFIILINKKQVFSLSFFDLGAQFKFYLQLKSQGDQITILKLEAQ